MFGKILVYNVARLTPLNRESDAIRLLLYIPSNKRITVGILSMRTSSTDLSQKRELCRPLVAY